ncbi:MAG: hypothetical protein M1474_03755 [Candidatus Marsarchaeota archaeon]|jgi:hypothetical protein|nr:hypothetical protein [Candidatus Marsarchaeota archaeon]
MTMRTLNRLNNSAMAARIGLCRPMDASELAKALAAIGERNKRARMAQLLDYGSVVSETHLRGAYLNALVAFEERTNIARTLAMETLLFAAMTRQISVAVERLGAKPGRMLVLMCSDRRTYDWCARLLGGCSAFRTTGTHERAAARALGVAGIGAEAVLGAMSMARLRD